jgi:hypothetical protein
MAKKIVFGSGTLWGVPSTTNSTPAKLAALQSVSLDIAFSTKELFGQHNFPLTVARGTGKIGLKASSAAFQARAFNDLFFNGALNSGKLAVALDEAGTIPAAAGPYTVLVSNSADFVSDLGVIDKMTGSLMKRVAAAPATGEYSVAAGTYTFAAADTGKAVLISYQYTVAASGQTLIIAQQLIGAAPKFKAVLSTKYDGQQIDLQLNACVATKLSFATKQEDFAIPDFEFSAFADDSGEVGRWVFPDAD